MGLAAFVILGPYKLQVDGASTVGHASPVAFSVSSTASYSHPTSGFSGMDRKSVTLWHGLLFREASQQHLYHQQSRTGSTSIIAHITYRISSGIYPHHVSFHYHLFLLFVFLWRNIHRIFFATCSLNFCISKPFPPFFSLCGSTFIEVHILLHCH